MNNKKIIFTLYFFAIFAFAQTKENSASDCTFLPAGYKTSFNINAKGELKNSDMTHLVSTMKDKDSQNYSFTTYGNNTMTADYINLKKQDYDLIQIKVGTRNIEQKKAQLAGTQINTISEYESVVSLKDGRCQLMSMTAQIADSNKKVLLYDFSVCADLLEKWNQFSKITNDNNCLKSASDLAKWYDEKDKFFQRSGISMSSEAKNNFSAASDMVTNCKANLKKNDASSNLNQEKIPSDWLSLEDYKKSRPKVQLQDYKDVLKAQREDPSFFGKIKTKFQQQLNQR